MKSKRPPKNKMSMQEAKRLAKEFDCDGSRLTPEQRKAIYKLFLRQNMESFGILQPRQYKYFEELSEPLSAEETVWPGVMADVKADRLQRGYLDPTDLAKRLRKLKPADNFELRKYRHLHIDWEAPRVPEGGWTNSIRLPAWSFEYQTSLSKDYRRLGFAEFRRRLSGVEAYCRKQQDEVLPSLLPIPDLHLLHNFGHSPGGTLFPRFLAEGLQALLLAANAESAYEDEENHAVTARREKAIEHWKKANPDSPLSYEPHFIFTTWPQELRDELAAFDAETMRRVREHYVNLLVETEKKMQGLVAFWRENGLITGQRSPPGSWWLVSPWEVFPSKWAPVQWPPYLKERLDSFEDLSWEPRRFHRAVEFARWKEAAINSGREPTPADTPFPQSLLDELEPLLQDKYEDDMADVEDAMMDIICRWRQSRHAQPEGQEETGSASENDDYKQTQSPGTNQQTDPEPDNPEHEPEDDSRKSSGGEGEATPESEEPKLSRTSKRTRPDSEGQDERHENEGEERQMESSEATGREQPGHGDAEPDAQERRAQQSGAGKRAIREPEPEADQAATSRASKRARLGPGERGLGPKPKEQQAVSLEAMEWVKPNGRDRLRPRQGGTVAQHASSRGSSQQHAKKLKVSRHRRGKS